MNDNIEPDASLPPMTDAAIERIESAVFARIAAERRPSRSGAERGTTRRRRWLTGAGIAAAFVVGVLITPPILGVVGAGAPSTIADGYSIATQGGGSQEMAPESAQDLSSSTVDDGRTATDEGATREIIASAQATVQVDDIGAAADVIATLADEHGGFVESTNIGRSAAVDGTTEPMPTDGGYGWISIRVPSTDLAAVIDALDETGEVVSSSISKQDVTSTAIDLRARVDATRASVQRLTELMTQSGSVSELIEAEVALTDRQAQLESYEQQLAALEDQVAMSSLQVQLTETAAPTEADPAGFGDGLLAGWNGLVVSLNALVIAIGFILPWLAVAAIVALVVVALRRSRRRRRREASADSENPHMGPDD
ncbi:DUF4349 domain-containing protein [Microbacterium sp.]|uniref:DUF4349 domain-containing protein n=1 Tax=Microbacterium sp. TaxID=51671 RepID=UPI0028120149|nr:DUF4349 domain-containing protein [Microbacterium sp.]